MTKNYTDTPALAFKRISEAIINWRDATVDIVNVIVEAKEREIWKLKYDTWREFCTLECGITPSWAARIVSANDAMRQIIAADKSKTLREKGADGTPETALPIKAVQSLKTVDPAVAASVLVDLKNQTPGVAPTAKAVAEAIAQIRAAEPETVMPDKLGYPIPFKVQETWSRAEETAKAALKVIQQIKSVLNQAEKENDIIYREFRLQENVGLLTSLFNNFKNVMPHAVCTTCQGKLPERCEECKGRGYVSAFTYQMFSNADVKMMRSKLKATNG